MVSLVFPTLVDTPAPSRRETASSVAVYVFANFTGIFRFAAIFADLTTVAALPNVDAWDNPVN
jgi:hypothetical protein